MKYVRDTKAAGQISAYVILNKKGKEVATVHAFHGESCLVNVFNYGDNKSAEDNDFMHSRASGYGYDKFTCALSGLVVDGVKLFNHCGTDKKSDNLLKRYHKAVESGSFDNKDWEKKAAKIGASFCNWNSEKRCWDSLHYKGGLDRLSAMGYKVIQAI